LPAKREARGVTVPGDERGRWGMNSKKLPVQWQREASKKTACKDTLDTSPEKCPGEALVALQEKGRGGAC